MTFEMFFSSFFTTLWSWDLGIVNTILLFFDGIIYDLVAKIYELFTLVSQLNFNYLGAIISPLIDRIEAVIMVFIMFKLGIALIQLMINPDDAPKTGTKLIKNIFIVGAMLTCYNLVFSALNEFSMLIIGVPENYSFTTLNRLAGVTNNAEDNDGLINRFIFGKDFNNVEIGDFLAFETLSIFIRDAKDETQSTILEKTIADGDGYNFNKVSNLSNQVGKDVLYSPFVSGLVGLYVIYCIGSVTIEVAVRMFKLMVLQLLAPIAIISKLNEKENMFNNFVKTYIQVYMSAFIRIATVLIINVFVGKFIINIDDFFGESLSDATGFGTKMFLTLIIIIAGYTFAKSLPDFIKQITGKELGKTDKSFGNLLGSMAGIGVGGVAGLAAGISSGAGVAGTIANMGAGAFSGGVNGFKGNSISDKIKNMSGSVKKDIARADDWGRRGFSNVVGGAIHGAIGTKGRQDMQMYKYDQANSALKAFESAQIEAIKDNTTGELTGFSGDEYKNIKFGEDKDAYANKMLEFNDGYTQAKASLEIAQKSGSASDIQNAELELANAKQKALTAAKDHYDRNKNAATNDNINAKKEAAEGAAKKAGIEIKTKDGNIDVKGTTKEITNKKHELENKTSYGQTHGASKDK
ncbi:MAG: hypothetical protein PUA90_06070 [bacterium]|nr:hypothetical protein [bacterium]